MPHVSRFPVRNHYILGFVGLLIFLLGIFALTTRRMERVSDYRPVQEGRTLSLRELQPAERVAIVIRRANAEPGSDRLYQIDGGTPRRFGAKPLDLAHPTDTAAGAAITGKLTENETIGLEAYLLFLRRGLPAGSHDPDAIVVTYFQNAAKIGEERYRGFARMFDGWRRDGGRIVRNQENAPEDFPPEVFREIVPPALIEQRLKEAGAVANLP